MFTKAKKAEPIMRCDCPHPDEPSEKHWCSCPKYLETYTPPKTGRRTKTRRTKNRIKIRDGHRCQYCGITYAQWELTIDHIIPISKDGADREENMVAACQPCNLRKGSNIWLPLNGMEGTRKN